MMLSFLRQLACAAVLSSAAAQFFPAAAQGAQRVKAKVVSFDGETLILDRLSQERLPQSGPSLAPGGGKGPGLAMTKPTAPDEAAASKVPDDKRLTVAVLPDTRYVGIEESSFAAIKVGDFAGAAVVESRNGRLRASEVFLYPETLRGTGEGRFPEAGRLLINGEVSAVKPTTPEDRSDGVFTLRYRGSVLTPLGQNRSVCEGRAAPPAFASPLACSGAAAVQVGPNTPVKALIPGDKSLLVPDAIVTATVAKNTAGEPVTPGVVVERPDTVEKPQSPN